MSYESSEEEFGLFDVFADEKVSLEGTVTDNYLPNQFDPSEELLEDMT